MPDRVAAIASVAVVNHHEGCSTVTPLVAFAGEKDPIVQIDRGLSLNIPFSGPPEQRLGPPRDEAAAWARANGCQPLPTVSNGGGGVAKHAYSCPADAQVVLHAGGHAWPGGLHSPEAEAVLGPAADFDANGIILDFFRDPSTP